MRVYEDIADNIALDIAYPTGSESELPTAVPVAEPPLFAIAASDASTAPVAIAASGASGDGAESSSSSSSESEDEDEGGGAGGAAQIKTANDLNARLQCTTLLW